MLTDFYIPSQLMDAIDCLQKYKQNCEKSRIRKTMMNMIIPRIHREYKDNMCDPDVQPGNF